MRKPTIDEILSAFKELTQSDDDPRGNPLKMRILQLFDAAPDGLIATELVEAVLGRKVTSIEDDYIYLHVVDCQGQA
jgi:hypothetical protein